MNNAHAEGDGKATAPTILDVAMEMADEGIPVFPVGRKKTPALSKKRVDELFGDGKYGLHMATTDPDKLEKLFSEPGVSGIGMPTGKASKVTVIDVDCGKGKKNAEEAKAWLEERRKTILWGTKVVRTTSGGLHYYCRYTPEIPSAGNVWAKGVDCRNDGGYVVVPPFMGYRVVRDTDPDDWPAPPPAPKALTKKVKDYTESGGETPPEVLELIRIMNEARGDDDGWHTAAVRLTAHLVGAGWDDAEILRLAVQWTKNGYTERETFEDLCVMVAGARRKWNREKSREERSMNAVTAIKTNLPKLTLKQKKDLHEVLGNMISKGAGE